MKTLAKFLFFTCFCCNNLFVTAQVDTSTTQKLLQYIFQNIDKTQISSGYLGEYGCPILPMQTFNGTLSDSNQIDMNLWRTLYFQLQTAYTGSGSNPLPVITSVNSSIASAGTSPVTIPLLVGQYNTVSSNAFSSNLLTKSKVNYFCHPISRHEDILRPNITVKNFVFLKVGKAINRLQEYLISLLWVRL